jgi:hypothetical protein
MDTEGFVRDVVFLLVTVLFFAVAIHYRALVSG